jgi:replicative DNA helicase
MTTVKRIYPEQGHMPPQAMDLEQAVLGALMLEESAFAEVSDFLSSDHFYNMAHRLIYTAIKEQVSSGGTVNILTIAERLRFTGKLHEAGDPFYISQLTNKVASSARIQEHARIIQQKFILRTFQDLGARLTTINDTDDPFDVNDQAQKAFAQVAEIVTTSDPVNAMELATQIIENRERPARLALGLGVVDQCVGVGPGDIVVIGARPAVGKTAVALQIARSFATQACPTAFVTLEMSGEQLMGRILSSLTGIDSNRITTNDLSEYDRELMAREQTTNAAWIGRLHIEDRASLKSSEVFGMFHRFKNRFQCGAVIIDYIQLMDGEGDTMNEKMSNVSKWCKQAAKANGIRLIELSQLARKDDAQTNPQLAYLRDSGQIEADGDIVILLGRDTGSSQLLIRVAKHKFGPVGDHTVYYDLQHQRIGGANIPQAIPPLRSFTEPQDDDFNPFA